MTDALEAVVAAVRERVSPDPDERERLADVVETLRSRATEALAEHGLADDADIVLVGSTARRTWIAGDRDVDVFVRLPVALDREELERVGLAVGHAVLPDDREEYAEHPYVTGELGGFDVDLVPCYAVEDATDIRSAVDRTPFHTAYLEERLDAELAGEVRVAKAFCKAIGVYGSDLRTRGFSGFLVELLVLEFGGFVPFLTSSADWEPPVRLDP
jgi:tRNA nucleotidyltransferase (CCA-adding enzyme)